MSWLDACADPVAEVLLGYFYEDWESEAGHADAQIGSMVAAMLLDELVIFRDGLDALLGSLDEESAVDWWRNTRCRYDPTQDGFGILGWLRHIRRPIVDAVRERGNSPNQSHRPGR